MNLKIGGCDTVELSEAYGTPLYVTDENRIRENYRRISSAFSKRYDKVRVYYACKANTNLAILRILEQEGSHLDTVSTGEIFLGMRAGFSADRILYTANNFTDEELKYASEKGVTINLDDESHLSRLIAIRKPELVSFRVNPQIGAGHHEHCITAGKDVKFGILERDIMSAYESAKNAGIDRFGLHMHIGSGILSHEPHALAVKKFMSIAGSIAKKLKIKFEFLDIGGGFGVPYREDEEELNIERSAEVIVNIFKEACKKNKLGEPYLCIEPGRYLVCDSTILLTRVNTVKRAFKNFVGVDAGFNTLIRPAFYGSYHRVAVANKIDEEATEKYDIAGPICESGDILAKDRMLPKVEQGDLIAIMNAGAYGFSMSSTYNSRPRAAEILVKDGNHEIIRERETFDDLTKKQKIPRG